MHHGTASNQARIHMNGRVYDPNVGRFLSVDPVFQAPTNGQSVNPYSYVMNNPLSLTDPSGYITEHSGGPDTQPLKAIADVDYSSVRGFTMDFGGGTGAEGGRDSNGNLIHVINPNDIDHVMMLGDGRVVAQMDDGDDYVIAVTGGSGAGGGSTGTNAPSVNTASGSSAAQNTSTQNGNVNGLTVNWSDGSTGSKHNATLQGQPPVGGITFWASGMGSSRTLDEHQYSEVLELARLGFAEENDPKGVSHEKMIAGAEQIVLDRVGKPGFGSSIHDVIHQQGQFDAVGRQLWNDAANPGALEGREAANYSQALTSALLEYTGASRAPTFGATFYYNLGLGNPPPGFFTNDLKNGRLTYYGAILPSMLLLGPPTPHQ